MVSRQGWLIGICLFVAGQVLAQDITPAVPAPPPAAAQPQAATPAPPPADAKPVQTESAQSATPTSAAASNPLAEGELDADKIMAAQKAGYTIKNENGQTLLCRRDSQTGSRLRHRTSCMTPREWEQVKNQNEMQLKAIERTPRMSRQ